MAMSFMISRASSALRSISSHHFCTDSKKKLLNENILRALNSEIKSEEQRRTNHMMPPVPPPNFPFTIEDNPWDRNEITLKRDFNGEKIELLVKFFHDDYDYDYGEDDEEEGGQSNGVSDKEKPVAERFAPSVEVDVHISKKSGRKIMLQVSAATDDGVSANDIWVAEQSAANHLGPYPVGVDDEDELTIVLKEYLETRGLDKSNARFVCKYMISKSKRHRLLVLQKMKNFLVEE